MSLLDRLRGRDLGKNDDAAWFAAHPLRRFRARPMNHDERHEFRKYLKLDRLPLAEGEVWIVLAQRDVGRIPIAWREADDLDAVDDAYAEALWPGAVKALRTLGEHVGLDKIAAKMKRKR